MFLTVLLIGFALMMLFGFVMRRMRGPQPAASAAGSGRVPEPIRMSAMKPRRLRGRCR